MTATVRSIIAVVFIVVAVTILRPAPAAAQTVGQLQARIVALEQLVATLQGQIGGLAAEAAARQAADAALQTNINTEAATRATADTALQTQINNVPTVPQNLLDLANYVSVDLNTINNLVGPHVIFSGANVHIQNGSGVSASTNGVGNLIVGYDEEPSPGGTRPRDGSHNLVVGDWHSYSSYGGLVAGQNNVISGPLATVSGGSGNSAVGAFSSVSGGASNGAAGQFASVSGGLGNSASFFYASVSGGQLNIASGYASTVSGGQNNTASGYASTVSGGQANLADTVFSHVP